MNMPNNNQPDLVQLHHRRTIRIKGYDYSQTGAYSVTICAYQKQLMFGDYIGGRIELSDVGELIRQCWLGIPRHFTNVGCEEFVIMPNHIHGIIVINEKYTFNNSGRYHYDSSARRGAACCAPTREKPCFKVAPGSLGAIVRSFKSAVTKLAHKCSEHSNILIWQRNYYEHIIRNESDLSEKRKYIIDNPVKWNEDEYNSIDYFGISEKDFNPGRMLYAPTRKIQSK